MRESITKHAAEAPDAIVVDIDDLEVPAESAWLVFTSARWLIARWQNLQLLLVANCPEVRSALQRHGITRYCPCFADEQEAYAAAAVGVRSRRQAITQIPAAGGSAACRVFVRDTLARWSLDAYRTTALVIATELVENAIRHTPFEPSLRLEHRPSGLTIAVADDSDQHPVRRENPEGTALLSGLGLVTSLATAWGSTPRFGGGKVVWAVIGKRDVI
ncbi:MAG: sulfate transporter [Aldersonia sp.]|nr:sulfate transporter [Aldersonia sp.]